MWPECVFFVFMFIEVAGGWRGSDCNIFSSSVIFFQGLICICCYGVVWGLGFIIPPFFYNCDVLTFTLVNTEI